MTESIQHSGLSFKGSVCTHCFRLYYVSLMFFHFFFSACDNVRDVFLCVSKFSRLKSSVCNGIKRDTCLTPIPGQLSVFNAICGLPLLVGFVPYC